MTHSHQAVDFPTSCALAQQIDPGTVLEYVPRWQHPHFKWYKTSAVDRAWGVTWLVRVPRWKTNLAYTAEWVGQGEPP